MIKKIVVVVVSLLLVGVMGFWLFSADQIVSGMPIAEYDGHIFYYRDILPDSDAHRVTYEHNEILEGSLLQEKKRLSWIVSDYIIESNIEKYKIEISETEIDIAVATLMQNLDKDDNDMVNALNKGKEEFSQVFELMQVWLTDTSKGDELYRTEYMGLVSVNEWENYKKIFDTQEKLLAYKNNLDNFSVENMQEGYRYQQKRALQWKALEKALIKDGEILLDGAIQEWIVNEHLEVKFIVEKYNYWDVDEAVKRELQKRNDGL